MPIFQAFRALGYITDDTPFSVQRRGRETFVTVSVGKAWQLYNCAKLSLVFVGPQLKKTIRVLVSWRDFTFAANGHQIAVFNRISLVSTWCGHTDKVLLLLHFGEHIISVGADHRMLIWNVASLGDDVTAEGEITLSSGFQPTCIVHPDTYLNKVLLGSQEGKLQLWNISSKQLIYEFKGWGSAVVCCTPSPALDTVAVGTADGKVHLHNLKFDEPVMSLLHSSKGPVTALTFRTDGQPLLAAGGTTGIISIWNLEKRKLQTVVKDAHDGPVIALHFFAREPVLLSSGADNSLKMWIFDTEDGEARLLRFRNGHSSPPSCIQHYGNGRHILCAGQDRSFRVFSTIQDQQSRELSQGHLAKRAKKLNLREEELKLSRVVAFAAAEIRERDWCNVVTCHEGDPAAYTWQLSKFVIGEHLLKPPGGDLAPVTACEISACGNFALIGAANGRVDRFNLQSGIHRRSYSPIRQQYASAHEGAIVGLHTDATNATVITAGYDGLIKVWDFKKGSLKSTLSARSALVKTAYHRVNGLLVAASDDLVIRVFDVTAARLVRKFEGHSDRITDMHLSSDGRWLLTSAMDRSVRTWDLVQSRLLDCMECEVAVTGLSLSPGMDMLSTIHVNRNGIYLWANKLMYSGLDDSDILPRTTPSAASVSMPTVSSGTEPAEGDFSEAAAMAEVDPVSVLPSNGMEAAGGLADVGGGSDQQLLPDLVTLAMLPRTQWQNLINLDIIKARNKPIAPPKKPEQAPFFLPTLPSLAGETIFAPRLASGEGGAEGLGSESTASRVKRQAGLTESRSEFSRLLHQGAEKNDFSSLRKYLRGLSPSAIDLELSMMEIVEEEGDVQEEDLAQLELLLHFLTVETAAKRDFEFLQAILHRVLAVHGEVIARESRLKEKATSLLKEQQATWQKLDDLFQSVRCTVGYLSNTQ